MRRIVAAMLVVVLIAPAATASAQSANAPERQSRKGRIIATLVGIGGGFALGVFAGFAWFDDATYSDRKVTQTVVAFTAAGGVGGYLIGRAIDKRGNATARAGVARTLPMPASLPRLRQPIPAAAPLAPTLFEAEPARHVAPLWPAPAFDSVR